MSDKLFPVSPELLGLYDKEISLKEKYLLHPFYKASFKLSGHLGRGRRNLDRTKIQQRETRKNKQCLLKNIQLLRFFDEEIDKNWNQVASNLDKVLCQG